MAICDDTAADDRLSRLIETRANENKIWHEFPRLPFLKFLTNSRIWRGEGRRYLSYQFWNTHPMPINSTGQSCWPAPSHRSGGWFSLFTNSESWQGRGNVMYYGLLIPHGMLVHLTTATLRQNVHVQNVLFLNVGVFLWMELRWKIRRVWLKQGTFFWRNVYSTKMWSSLLIE